jgi:hypothetical protein
VPYYSRCASTRLPSTATSGNRRSAWALTRSSGCWPTPWELLPVSFDTFLLRREFAPITARTDSGRAPELEHGRRSSRWGAAVDCVRATDRHPGARAQGSSIARRLQPSCRGVSRAAAESAACAGTWRFGTLSPRPRHCAPLPAERAAAVVETGYDYLNRGARDGDSRRRRRRRACACDSRSRSEITRLRRRRACPGLRPDQGHRTRRFAAAPGSAIPGIRRARAAADLHDCSTTMRVTSRGAGRVAFHLRARAYEGASTCASRVRPVRRLIAACRATISSSRDRGAWRPDGKRTLAKSGAEAAGRRTDGGMGARGR